jgi:predicted transcriptional regulator
MKILLSIKPEFAQSIFRGQKEYEYRKSIFRRKDVDKAIVYATRPVCRVIGEFSIESVLKSSPFELWEGTSRKSGISKRFFDQYFQGRKIGFALKIKNPVLYKEPVVLSHCCPV